MTSIHSAKLVWVTPNAENVIAYCARVSNPSNQTNYDTAPRLLKYCVKNKHWSVFETVNMCVEVKTTRSVAAQILRHRSFSFQEFSQRYAEVTEFPQIPDLRRQDLENRQNSINDVPSDKKQHFQDRIHKIFTQSLSLYNEMIEEGLAKECVRDILPLSTPTTLYMNGTLRSWLHYCDLRTANGTQLEHKYIAESCKTLIQQQFPQVYTAMWEQP
jgi:thymidylate synthase (FAD)